MNTNQLHGIYPIVNADNMAADSLLLKVQQALTSGITILQYRNKNIDDPERKSLAQQLLELCHQHQALFIVNDDIHLARTINADGVHLGQCDETLINARKYLGESAIIGITCHNSIDLALQAEQQSANYVSFGCFFPSTTKPQAKPAHLDILSAATQALQIPVCAIGGINMNNIKQVMHYEIDMIAISDAIFSENQSLQAVDELITMFNAHQNASLDF